MVGQQKISLRRGLVQGVARDEDRKREMPAP
jgi:hypothetical protein